MWTSLVLLCVAIGSHGQLRFSVPQTPCADVFDYVQYGKRAYKAHVTVPSPAPGQELKLDIHLYAEADAEPDNQGNISLTYGEDYNKRKIAEEEITHIEYDVHFPFLNPLPEVDRITANGKIICEGPIIVNPHSRLNLKHTLPPLGQSTTTTQRPISANECGLTINSSPLVFGGTPIERGDWPWLAAIYEIEDHVFSCGGSLINKRHVITAAHCIKHVNSAGETIVHSKDDLLVELGRYELSNRGERFVEPRNVEAIHIPDDYDAAKFYFSDIAVLVLDNPVEYTQFIRPICLWKSDQNIKKVINKNATVVGWGRTENETVTNIAKKGNVLVVSRDDCIASFPLHRLFTNNRTLCAGYRDGKGPCTGDSGGPMMTSTRSGGRTRWYLSGIVSNAISDRSNDVCNLRQYTVYTDVVKYLSWLRPFTHNMT